jgi:short chain dehydrogenase
MGAFRTVDSLAENGSDRGPGEADGSTSAGILMSRLEGTVALVTGGARGIGAAIARAMADHGAKAVIGHLLERDDELLAKGSRRQSTCTST